jgi:predicted secreted protein
MMIRVINFISYGAIILLLISCASSKSKHHPKSGIENYWSVQVPNCSHLINEFDTTKRAEIEVGDTLCARLRGLQGAGYRWRIASFDSSIVMLVAKPDTVISQKYFHRQNPYGDMDRNIPTDTSDTPSQSLFRFQGLTAGQTQIRINLYRPIEKTDSPVDKFEMTVIVNPKNPPK